ncbi:MAG: hypothetical protein DRP45_01990 [Candidatus Zixiibacteriota bacterium]|nr:MAG: hypothetical protein DRP45_01990 [candidate division Zixibacteria bacterium]
MRKYIRKLVGEKGTSLLEMMIALVLTGIITTAILKVYTTQHNSYIVQDDVASIQQNARATIDELTRHIRMAGHQLPLGLQAIAASNTDPDTITVVYRTSNCETTLSAKMPNPSAELKCATNVSCFHDGQWVYIFHPDSGGGEWFEITHVQTGANHIQHNTMVLSQAYDADAILLAVEMVKFFIDTTTTSGKPLFMVQRAGGTPQPYAENISDLQFRYRLANGTIVDEPVLISDVREVLIYVRGQSGYVLDGENGSPERVRMYSSSVNLRNIGN